ncbi:hypothetical protein DL98DRAFT_421643, partial [Cadophora sp. DSE1049]
DCGVEVPEEKLLAPLREMKADIFEVFLPWPGEFNRTGDFEGGEFVVRRPPEGMDLTMHLDVVKACRGPATSRPFWQRIRRA